MKHWLSNHSLNLTTMKKYAVKTTRFEGTVVYGFGDDERLCLMQIDGVHEQHAHKQLCSVLPINEAHLMAWKTKAPHLTITELLEDISFENFWERYNYKHGRQEAEAAYKKLTDTEKALAIKAIPAYDRYCADKGIAKAYAQKYLNKKRFNDEYK